MVKSFMNWDEAENAVRIAEEVNQYDFESASAIVCMMIDFIASKHHEKPKNLAIKIAENVITVNEMLGTMEGGETH